MSDEGSTPPPPRRPRFTQPGLHKFKRKYFYCIDGADRPKPKPPLGNETPGRSAKSTMHEDNVWDVQYRVEKYGDFVYIIVQILPNNNAKALYEWFEHELGSKTEDDFLVFYYEGHAYGKDKGYFWRFDKEGHVDFNAYDIYKLCGASGLACLFLQDCETPTGWSLSSKLPAPKGYVSIIGRGGVVRDSMGQFRQDRGSLTECFTESLSNAGRDVDTGAGKNELQTIVKLISSQKPTYRLHRGETVFKERGSDPIMHFVVDPRAIRKNKADNPGAGLGKVEFMISVTPKGGSGLMGLMGPPPTPDPGTGSTTADVKDELPTEGEELKFTPEEDMEAPDLKDEDGEDQEDTQDDTDDTPRKRKASAMSLDGEEEGDDEAIDDTPDPPTSKSARRREVKPTYSSDEEVIEDDDEEAEDEDDDEVGEGEEQEDSSDGTLFMPL